VLLLVTIVVGCSAVYLWSRPLVVPPVVEPVVKPVNVTLGVITYNPVAKLHFDYIANTTLNDVNAYAASKGYPYRFDYLSRNIAGVAGGMEKGVVDMSRTEGVKIFLGFDSTEYMCASLSYAISNHVILMGVPLIHHNSSALPGDVMFRVAPNLRQIHIASAKIVKGMGFKGVMVIQRGDSWGDGIVIALEEALGSGSVMKARYDMDSTDYSGALDSAASQLPELIARHGAQWTAIVLVSAAETNKVLEEAAKRDGLMSVPWVILQESPDPYSIAEELPDMLGVSVVAGAKLITLKMAPITDNPVFAKLQSGYSGVNPGESLGLIDASFRDSIWIACLSIMEANTTDAEVLKGIIPGVADGYTGASGRVLLDANGDRMVNYDIFEATFTGEAPAWVKSGRYDATTGQVTLGGE
jgi:ABC-type branched-subunit amino acid transport system substrate-binding protein